MTDTSDAVPPLVEDDGGTHVRFASEEVSPAGAVVEEEKKEAAEDAMGVSGVLSVETAGGGSIAAEAELNQINYLQVKDLVREGWLLKKPFVGKEWKYWFFVLRGKSSEDIQLLYCEEGGTVDECKAVDLYSLTEIVIPDESKMKYPIDLVTTERIWHLAADTLDSQQLWHQTLNKSFDAIQLLSENLTPSTNLEGDEKNENDVDEDDVEILPESDKSQAEQNEILDDRQKVAREILTSELTYCTKLQELSTNFSKPLNDKGIIKPFEHQTLFQLIEMITQFHETILQNLIKSQNSCVATVFGEHAKDFRCYSPYINGYDKIVATFNELMDNNSRFEEFTQKVRADTNNDLMSLLIMPVQRLPRYELLLKELLKETPEEHEEHNEVFEALEKIKITNKWINETRRNREKHTKAMDLQNIIVGDNVPAIGIPGRTYLKTARFRCHKMRRLLPRENPLRTCSLFVFNDVVIWCDRRNRYLGTIHYESAVLIENPAILKEPQLGFQITDVSHENVSPLVAQCGTEQEAKEWIADLKEKLDSAKQKLRKEREKKGKTTVVRRIEPPGTSAAVENSSPDAAAAAAAASTGDGSGAAGFKSLSPGDHLGPVRVLPTPTNPELKDKLRDRQKKRINSSGSEHSGTSEGNTPPGSNHSTPPPTAVINPVISPTSSALKLSPKTPLATSDPDLSVPVEISGPVDLTKPIPVPVHSSPPLTSTSLSPTSPRTPEMNSSIQSPMRPKPQRPTTPKPTSTNTKPPPMRPKTPKNPTIPISSAHFDHQVGGGSAAELGGGQNHSRSRSNSYRRPPPPSSRSHTFSGEHQPVPARRVRQAQTTIPISSAQFDHQNSTGSRASTGGGRASPIMLAQTMTTNSFKSHQFPAVGSPRPNSPLGSSPLSAAGSSAPPPSIRATAAAVNETSHRIAPRSAPRPSLTVRISPNIKATPPHARPASTRNMPRGGTARIRKVQPPSLRRYNPKNPDGSVPPPPPRRKIDHRRSKTLPVGLNDVASTLQNEESENKQHKNSFSNQNNSKDTQSTSEIPGKGHPRSLQSKQNLRLSQSYSQSSYYRSQPPTRPPKRQPPPAVSPRVAPSNNSDFRRKYPNGVGSQSSMNFFRSY